MGLYDLSVHSYDQSKYGLTKPLHRSAYERLVVTQLDAALKFDLVTDQPFNLRGFAMLLLTLTRPIRQVSSSTCTSTTSFLGASFTLEVNPTAEPSTQAIVPDSFDHVSSTYSTFEHQNDAPIAIIPT